MTDTEYAVIGWTLVAIAWLWLSVALAQQVVQHVREERGRKARPLPGALGASMEARLAEVFPPWEPLLRVGAEPPYSVTYIDPAIVGGSIDQWFVMGTVDGDPRDQCGPVAICEYEPSAHVIAALLNASGGCEVPS